MQEKPLCELPQHQAGHTGLEFIVLELERLGSRRLVLRLGQMKDIERIHIGKYLGAHPRLKHDEDRAVGWMHRGILHPFEGASSLSKRLRPQRSLSLPGISCTIS